jgi:hypothetical protein
MLMGITLLGYVPAGTRYFLFTSVVGTDRRKPRQSSVGSVIVAIILTHNMDSNQSRAPVSAQSLLG